MELKCGYIAAMAVGNGCSNRTFMELKLLRDYMYKQFKLVLIVPLWN